MKGLRQVPKVDRLLAHASAAPAIREVGRQLFTEALRRVLNDLRARLRKGERVDEISDDQLVERAARTARAETRPRLRRVINATGVILHTGLGRAVLPPAAIEALAQEHIGFSLLELDLETGERGERESAVAELLTRLTGAQAATVVNNNAGATLLALAAFAARREVICSRGQLVEIGGSFRIPEVMEASGARLVAVGTTNRTYVSDYEAAITDSTALLLRVHTSNFRVIGFACSPSLEELVQLGRRRGIPVMDDLGSGALIDFSRWALAGEPVASQSVRGGADVICFSGDKLLGGPQAGILIGRREPIARIRRHPLFRALRPDKLQLTALEATLRLYLDPERLPERLPVLRMIAIPLAQIEASAAQLADRLRTAAGLTRVEIMPATSQVGGGSMPGEELPTRLVAVEHRHHPAQRLAELLRRSEPPIFTRIVDDRVCFDVRTLLEGEAQAIETALRSL